MLNTLCWKCANACEGCSWSREFKPVKGWKATETRIMNQDRITKSYNVIYCPKFVPDKPKKNDKLNNEELAKREGISIRTYYRRKCLEKLKAERGN